LYCKDCRTQWNTPYLKWSPGRFAMGAAIS
jgi:hypothetical protein